MFVRPKSTASAVSMKSILKTPKLQVVKEEDENEASNSSVPHSESKIDLDEVDGVTFGPLPDHDEEKQSDIKRTWSVSIFEPDKIKTTKKNLNGIRAGQHIFGGLILIALIFSGLLLPLKMRYHFKQKNKAYFFYQINPSDAEGINGIDETRILQVKIFVPFLLDSMKFCFNIYEIKF